MSILSNGRLVLTSLPVASQEEVARINTIRQEKEERCTHLDILELPRAFRGFLDPKSGLGDIPQTHEEK